MLDVGTHSVFIVELAQVALEAPERLAQTLREFMLERKQGAVAAS